MGHPREISFKDSRQLGAWPGVNLVRDYSKLGRSSVNLSAPLIIALGRLSQSMSELKDACTPLAPLRPKITEMLEDRLKKADAAMQTYGGSAPASEHPNVEGASVDPQLVFMLLQIAPCAEAFNKLHVDGVALTDRVTSYSDALAHIPRNEQPRDRGLLSETQMHVKRVIDLVDVWKTANQEFVYTEPPTATIADYRAAFQQDVDFMKTKDLPGMYQGTLAELDKYYDVVNRLVASR